MIKTEVLDQTTASQMKGKNKQNRKVRKMKTACKKLNKNIIAIPGKPLYQHVIKIKDLQSYYPKYDHSMYFTDKYECKVNT
jgi:hypothetical protein